MVPFRIGEGAQALPQSHTYLNCCSRLHEAWTFLPGPAWFQPAATLPEFQTNCNPTKVLDELAGCAGDAAPRKRRSRAGFLRSSLACSAALSGSSTPKVSTGFPLVFAPPDSPSLDQASNRGNSGGGVHVGFPRCSARIRMDPTEPRPPTSIAAAVDRPRLAVRRILATGLSIGSGGSGGIFGPGWSSARLSALSSGACSSRRSLDGP